jgi:O-6-methylguanine DNA methyltransferase
MVDVNLIHTTYESTLIGQLLLVATDKGLCNIEFGADEPAFQRLRSWIQRHHSEYVLEEAPHSHPHLEAAKQQLTEYFSGERREFDISLDIYGTPFQLKVWQALQAIPYARTHSYKDIAVSIGQPQAVRAVGGANNKNPLPVIVPCHRVIGNRGDLVGYGGGLPIKQSLLSLEGSL